jgi:site-specific recombinase XerD
LNCKTLKRFFHWKYLDEIISEMVEDFKSARKQERIQWAKNRSVTGATVNRAWTTLKLLYHQGERNGYSVSNPTVGVSMFREPLDSMRVINFDEQAAYLAETSPPCTTLQRSSWIRVCGPKKCSGCASSIWISN